MFPLLCHCCLPFRPQMNPSRAHSWTTQAASLRRDLLLVALLASPALWPPTHWTSCELVWQCRARATKSTLVSGMHCAPLRPRRASEASSAAVQWLVPNGFQTWPSTLLFVSHLAECCASVRPLLTRHLTAPSLAAGCPLCPLHTDDSVRNEFNDAGYTGVGPSLLSGAVAGAASTVVTFPADVVMRNLQVRATIVLLAALPKDPTDLTCCYCRARWDRKQSVGSAPWHACDTL